MELVCCVGTPKVVVLGEAKGEGGIAAEIGKMVDM